MAADECNNPRLDITSDYMIYFVPMVVEDILYIFFIQNLTYRVGKQI